MTPFFQFFYIYGFIYVGCVIYDFIDSFTPEDPDLEESIKVLGNTKNDIADIFVQGHHIENIREHTQSFMKSIPLALMNIVWILMGLYTEQYVWFAFIILLFPYEICISFVGKSKFTTNFACYSSFGMKIIFIVVIYYLKFFA